MKPCLKSQRKIWQIKQLIHAATLEVLASLTLVYAAVLDKTWQAQTKPGKLNIVLCNDEQALCDPATYILTQKRHLHTESL